MNSGLRRLEFISASAGFPGASTIL